MVEQDRLRIGIFFGYTSIWLGGVYYIKSLINSLNCLEDELKPFIVVFYTEESEQFTKEFDYNYLEFKKFKPVHKHFGYVYSWVLRKNLFVTRITKNNHLDGLFPVNDMPVKTTKSKTRIVSWFPDLQHKFYPEYFSKSYVFLREQRVKMLVRNAQVLVVSSEDVLSHFKMFYELPLQLRFTVLPFISNIQKSLLKFDEIKQKYKIEKPYFMVSNQFYEHKNHKVVFEALALLKSKNIEVEVVFTGKFEDYKNPQHISNLQNIIKNSGIDTLIKNLGIIPREEQIALMVNALAVIQPSLFEGWSTVVEDAKTLQIPIIASDIPVHIEQLGEKGFYFKSTSDESLSEMMVKFLNNTIGSMTFFENFKEREKIFAKGFIDIFKQ